MELIQVGDIDRQLYKGSGSNWWSFQQIRDTFDECHASCGIGVEEEMNEISGVGSESYGGTSLSKPWCCKDGVSALKIQYIGKSGTTFFLPDHDAIDDFIIADSCSGGVDENFQSTFKFADCDKCFPSDSKNMLTSCDPINDIYDSVVLEDSQIFCLVSFDEVSSIPLFDETLPTDLTLFFQEDPDDIFVTPFNIHTSCRKPIYPPFAFQLGVCPSDNHLYVMANEEDTANRKLEDAMPFRPSFLNFLDGVSVYAPGGVLLSNCGPETHETNQCCEGGASFLRTVFSGTERSGFLTFKSSVASLFSSCVDENTNPCEVRFVSCADSCHTDPFSKKESCSPPFDIMEVDPGDEVCFGLWDDVAGRIAYNRNMPTKVPIYFIPSSGDAFSVFAGKIYTSCNNPVYAPFAQALDDACFSNNPPIINLQEKEGGDLPIHLAFVDGISRGYYKAASTFDEDLPLLYDISFAECGCACESWLVPTPAPSCDHDHPLDQPSMPPTTVASNQPSVVPSVSSKPSSCAEACAAFVFDNCVFNDGSGDSCDIDSGNGRLLLHSNPLLQADTTADNWVSMLSPEAKLSFHQDMVVLLAELNSLIE